MQAAFATPAATFLKKYAPGGVENFAGQSIGYFSAPGYTITPTTVTYSATPALYAVNGPQTITLTGNAAPTISGIAVGQRVTFQICQNATGNYTWTWPISIHGGMTISSAASTCSIRSFDSFSGTTLEAESGGVSGLAP